MPEGYIHPHVQVYECVLIFRQPQERILYNATTQKEHLAHAASPAAELNIHQFKHAYLHKLPLLGRVNLLQICDILFRNFFTQTEHKHNAHAHAHAHNHCAVVVSLHSTLSGLGRNVSTHLSAVVVHSTHRTQASDRRCASLWSPYVIGQTIVFSSCFFLSSSFLFPRIISAVRDWMSTILPHT